MTTGGPTLGKPWAGPLAVASGVASRIAARTAAAAPVACSRVVFSRRFCSQGPAPKPAHLCGRLQQVLRVTVEAAVLTEQAPVVQHERYADGRRETAYECPQAMSVSGSEIGLRSFQRSSQSAYPRASAERAGFTSAKPVPKVASQRDINAVLFSLT